MKLHCPHCGVKGSADDSYRGRKVKCPKCKGIFEVIRDVPAELSEDVALYSVPASSPAKSSVSVAEDAASFASKEGAGNDETAQSLSIDAAEEVLDFEDEPAEFGPATTAPAQELAEEVEPLNWDDLTSEIELQLGEREFETVREKIPEGSPVDVSFLKDEFDQPTAEEKVVPELVAIAGNYNEAAAEDESQPGAEKDKIEMEPSDAAIKAGANEGSNDKFSLGATIKKAWAKIKNVLFS